ncbi:hypothetical protein ACFPZ0_04855 [Streptomonospora nanhaiensis]|uniref:hypothetical protein n=1 Tax=Streptomonospora nanhaiensis TaxID=1323731 RepID=UPI001C99E049|nr:hypothetical protein [Streptomonospora nanhaiensis]MBX9387322.1 hypothetical protein [Streptomonospora nanhaiensis]
MAALCERAGLPTGGLRLLLHHATGGYFAPDAPALVRISSAADAPRLRTAVALTRWLTSHRFPVTEPLDIEHPLTDDRLTATFWVYYPQTAQALPAPRLGALRVGDTTAGWVL